MMEEASSHTPVVTAGLIVIGDEILSGRTKDKNIGHIAERLTAVGIRLREVRIVPDETDAIVAAVNALRPVYDYVFTTGGIGPTHDDITADAIAKAFGLPIEVDPRAVAVMRKAYSPDQLTPARLRMARMPEGAELVDNPVSMTPGFWIGNVIVMAGIPRIMQAMLEDVLPRLRKGQRLVSMTIRVHAKEGDVAPLLAGTQERFPDVMIGSYPFFINERHGTNVVLRSPLEARLAEAGDELTSRLAASAVSFEIEEPVSR